jgi:hypothetical protein
MFGVSLNVLPYQAVSAQPRSSARITTKLGLVSAFLTFDAYPDEATGIAQMDRAMIGRKSGGLLMLCSLMIVLRVVPDGVAGGGPP